MAEDAKGQERHPLFNSPLQGLYTFRIRSGRSRSCEAPSVLFSPLKEGEREGSMRDRKRNNLSRTGGFQRPARLIEGRTGCRDIVNKNDVSSHDCIGIRRKTTF